MLCPILVSRGAELHALSAALRRAREGAGGVLILAGDAGVGKSRLAREVSAQAASQGFDVLAGRATESIVPVPFRPITEALMKLARSGVTPDAPEMASYRPALGSLVPEWGRPEDGDAEISPLILGEALIRVLTPVGSKGTLLVLEDLHWADPETLAILEYLADNLPGTPVLCVATLRDSEPSAALDCARALHARRAAAMVEVRRLLDWAVRQMAAACLGADDVPAAVTALLADCDGLPFAVEEILAAAVSSGQLVSGTSGWQVNDEVSTGIPDSIAGSVRHRLAALGPVAIDVLVSAAVLGRQFDWTLLPAIAAADEAEVLAELQRAQHKQLIEPVVTTNHVLRFRHSLTRHAILSGLLPPDLAWRSSTAAAAVERAHPDLPGGWCELAAEVNEAAGERERAAELLLKVGQRALGKGALSTAATSLRDAAGLVAATQASDPMLAIEIEEALVEALALAGDYSQLAPVADRLLAKLDSADVDPRRQAVIRIRTARARSEDNPAAAAEHLAVARSIADRLGDRALASQVDAAAAHCAIDAGDMQAADELARRSLARAEEAGLHDWAADVAFDSLQVIGRTERARDLAAARSAFERAYQMATQQDCAVRRIAALHELGTVDMLEHASTARLSEARELANKSGALSTMTVIDLQLASVWSMGVPRALAGGLRRGRTSGDQPGSGRGHCRRVEQGLPRLCRGGTGRPRRALSAGDGARPGGRCIPESLGSLVESSGQAAGRTLGLGGRMGPAAVLAPRCHRGVRGQRPCQACIGLPRAAAQGRGAGAASRPWQCSGTAADAQAWHHKPRDGRVPPGCQRILQYRDRRQPLYLAQDRRDAYRQPCRQDGTDWTARARGARRALCPLLAVSPGDLSSG